MIRKVRIGRTPVGGTSKSVAETKARIMNPKKRAFFMAKFGVQGTIYYGVVKVVLFKKRTNKSKQTLYYVGIP